MKNFYEVLLPEKGKYCVATKKGGEKLKQHFVDSVDELVDLVNKVKDDGANVYFALGGFNDDSSRLATNCHSLRSFFFDLDCKGGDTYDTQEDAIQALQLFCKEVKLPRPTLVNSGNGIHAYWPFTESVKRDEWVSTARRLKDLCSYHKFNVDRKVTSDAARILRCPETVNYNGEPKKSELLTSSKQYDYARIKSIIDSACEDVGISTAPPLDLSKAKRELDEDTKALLKLDNIESKFSKIARRSLEGTGCAHIKLALEEPNNCSEPMWRACLSVAVRCSDGATAIHKLSEGHDEYDPSLTEEKANSTLGPFRCETFDDEDPGKCDGCQHRGKISSPIQLGKVLKKSEPEPASEETPDPVEADGALEKALFPFRRVNGSIYYQPPPEFDAKKKQKIELDPILVYENRIDVVNRVVNKSDGECTLIRLQLPKDGIKEFYLPNYVTQSPADFRKLLASEGVATSTKSMDRLMEYTTKWIKYLQGMKSADKMREQLGWSDDNSSFAWGDKEFTKNGERHSPPSSKTKEIASYQKTVGSFEEWKKMFNNFGREGFETHAFAAMAGFGAPLLKFTGFEGVVINLFSGASGTGKTAVLKATLSVWGDPKGLMVGDGTQLARFHRTAVLRNTPIGIDEATGIDPKTLSEFIYYLSLGKTKIRMQASSNAERENLGSWSTMGVMTSNNSYYDKLNQFKASADGESARLMEFGIKKPEIMMNDAIGKEFFDSVNHNYGHAGPLFIQYVVNNLPEVMHMLGAVASRFQRDFRTETKHRFWSAAVAANITGGMIAYKLGLHDIDMDRVYKHIVLELKKVSGISESVHADAFEVLNEFIALSANNTLVINSKSDSKITYHVEPTKTPTSGNGLYIRHETDTGETYILMKALTDYMAKRQYSRQRFEEELTKAGILIKVNCPKRMASGWDGGISNSTQNTYKIKLPSDVAIIE
jgi:hypothetical protein